MVASKNSLAVKKTYSFPEEEIIELSKQAFYGANQRAKKFEEYLKYYYEGSDKVLGRNRLKRLFGEINTILSLIFTPEAMILSPVCHENLNEVQRKILDTLIREVHDNFITYNRLDVEIEEAILHALIFGYTPIKVYWKGNGVLYKEVNPANFGVLYESLDLDDRQQVIVHKTFMTSEKIKFLYNIDIEEIVARKQQALKKSTMAELMNITKTRAVVDTTSGTVEEDYYKAFDARNLFEVVELYINEYYRTGEDRWHRFVVLPQEDLILEHSKLTGLRHPFFLMVLYPAYSSCLGVSLIEMIKEIQEKRIECLDRIDNLTELRTYPPIVVTGSAVSPDQIKEDINSLYTPKGHLVIQDPQARYEPYPPQTGLEELYNQMEYWNMQLKYVSGLYEIIMGESGGARTGKGMELLATFATSIFRKLAHRIETVLEDIFTYTAYLYIYNSDKDVIINGKRYKFADFPYDFRINIKSHTASPIDIKMIQELYLMMYRMGDIPAEMLFDLFNLPFKTKYEEYQNKKMAMAMQMKAIEEEKQKKK